MPNIRLSIQHKTAPGLPKADWQTRFSLFLLYGFFLLDKLFVYVAFPLTAFTLFDRRAFLDRVYAALTRRGPICTLTWILLLSTMYGVAEVVYGLLAGHAPLTAGQILVFNISPWFLFFGIHAGARRPFAVRDYIRFGAWYHAITGPLYFLFLRHLNLGFLGREGEFLAPGSGALILLGLFCLETNLARYWFPILVCSFDTIASQIRADWVGLGVAVCVWAVATRRVKRVAAMAGVIGLLLLIGLLADVRIPALPGRGGEISTRDTIGRAISGIAPDLARDFSANNDAQTYTGTVQWRENWWKAIRAEVFETPATAVFGLGYGYPIKDLVPYLKGLDVRSPHSVLYFTLAYSGLLGVVLFFSFQANLLLVHWRNFRQTGQIFGFTSLIFILMDALFGNLFEAPQHAVPTYLLWGLCLGPYLLNRAGAEPVRGGVDRTAPMLAPPPRVGPYAMPPALTASRVAVQEEAGAYR